MFDIAYKINKFNQQPWVTMQIDFVESFLVECKHWNAL